jgi:hypothetical protein
MQENYRSESYYRSKRFYDRQAKAGKKRVTVLLSGEVHKRLTAERNQGGVNLSELVEAVLVDAFDIEMTEPKLEPSKAPDPAETEPVQQGQNDNMDKAMIEFNNLMISFKAMGGDRKLALQTANTIVKEKYNVDFMVGTNHYTEPAQDKPEPTTAPESPREVLLPTDIAHRLGTTAIFINKFLIDHGFQTKDRDNGYQLTPKGERYGAYRAVSRTNKALKVIWSDEIVPVLKSLLEDAVEYA